MAAVKTAVDGLDEIEHIAPFLVRLGARHVRYGVVPAHFDLVGEALLWTLEQGLGESFTPWVAGGTALVLVGIGILAATKPPARTRIPVVDLKAP